MSVPEGKETVMSMYRIPLVDPTSDTPPVPKFANNLDDKQKIAQFQSDENPININHLYANDFKLNMFNKPKRSRNAWGNLSYAHLIAAAILSSPKQKMKLNEIYAWFTENIGYFSSRDDEVKSRGWKNSIRHNLSLKKEFIRESGDKKAGYWYIDRDTFLRRLRSENRQINDPVYNRDMQQFENYILRIMARNDQNEQLRYLAQNTLDVNSCNHPRPVMFSMPIHPPNPESYDPSNYQQHLSACVNSGSGLSGSQHSEDLTSSIPSKNINGEISSHKSPKQNPFQITSTNGFNMVSATLDNESAQSSKLRYSQGKGYENMINYSVADTLMAPRFETSGNFPNPGMNQADGTELSKAYYPQDNAGAQQYIAFQNYGIPFQPYQFLREQNPDMGYFQPIDYNYRNMNNYNMYTNTLPLIYNNQQIPQDLSLSASLGCDINKSVYNL